jgi:hypothetical protein
MNVKKALVAVVVDTALIVFGVYYDIRYLTIGGIVEGVDAIKANPLDKSELAWGIFKVMMSGVGLFAAIVLCIAVTAAIYGKSVKAAVGRALKPRPKRARRV